MPCSLNKFPLLIPTNSLRKCMKFSVENLYLYIGAHGVRFIPLEWILQRDFSKTSPMGCLC